MDELYLDRPFPLENGQILPGIRIAYHTYGRLNASRDNVVWICHALTANSDVGRWWPGMIGPGLFIDTDRYFVICANMLGSCYGTTGPLSENSATGKPYYTDFPAITIRDMVAAHMLLCNQLQIDHIALLVGASMGGYQALEWAVQEPNRIARLFLIATSAAESAWGIAVHTAQRLAIEADSSWRDRHADAGGKGLKAARAIGILTYRNYLIMDEKQSDPDPEKLDGFRAASYISYQGDKLVRRFSALCYHGLTRAMDTHNISRGRGGLPGNVLRILPQPTLIIGIDSDILCPVAEQEMLAEYIPDSTLVTIDSHYGHDGFMVETEKVGTALTQWLEKGGRD